MKFLLLDMNSNPKTIGSFDITQNEINNNFYKVVKEQVSNLLHIPIEKIQIMMMYEKSTGNDYITAWEHFVDESFSFKLNIAGSNQYYVIPS